MPDPSPGPATAPGTTERNEIFANRDQVRFEEALESARKADEVVILRPTSSGVLAIGTSDSLGDLQGLLVGVKYIPETNTYDLRSCAQTSPLYEMALSSPDGTRWQSQDKLNPFDYLPSGIKPGTALQLDCIPDKGVLFRNTVILPNPTAEIDRHHYSAAHVSLAMDSLLRGNLIIAGLHPSASENRLIAGSIGTTARHISMQMRDGVIFLQDLGSGSGFFLKRSAFGGSVVEHIPSGGTTKLLPYDKVWLGGSPDLGLAPDLQTPQFATDAKITVGELGTCWTASSFTALNLRNQLQVPTIGISPSPNLECRLGLVNPSVNFIGTLTVTNQRLGTYSLRGTQGFGCQMEVVGTTRKSTVTTEAVRLELLPRDWVGCAASSRPDAPRIPLFQLPVSPAYERQMAEGEAVAAALRMERQALVGNVTRILDAQVQRLIDGDVEHLLIHRKLEEGRVAPGIEVEGINVTTPNRLTITAEENGRYRITAQTIDSLPTIFVRYRDGSGDLLPNQPVRRNQPVILAPGDVLVLPVKNSTPVEYTMPPNQFFDAVRESAMRPQLVDVNRSVLATFNGTIGTLGDIVRPGGAKVDAGYLKATGLQPTGTINLAERRARFDVSAPFAMDSAGRIGVVAIVNIDGARSVRVYYTTMTQAPNFRLLPAVNDGERVLFAPGYDKAGKENALNLPWELLKPLWAHVINSYKKDGRIRDLSPTPEIWQSAVRLNGNVDDYITYDKDVELNPAKNCKGVEIVTSGTVTATDLKSIRIPNELVPNVDLCVDNFEIPKLPFGPTKLYGAPLQNFHYLSLGGTLGFTFSVAQRGQYVPNVEFRPGSSPVKLTPFGIPDMYVEAGEAVLSLFERPDQVPNALYHKLEKAPGFPHVRCTRQILSDHPWVRLFLERSKEAGLARRRYS